MYRYSLYRGVKPHIIFSILICLFSCTQLKEKVARERIKDYLERTEELQSLLNGQWSGTHYSFSPTYDTIYFSSLSEKVEYLLFDTLQDSTLIKKLILKDSFKLAPISIQFKVDSATIDLKKPDTSFQVKFEIVAYQRPYIHFGTNYITDVNSNDSAKIPLANTRHYIFQNALCSQSLDLVIDKLDADSLILSLELGWDQIRLKKSGKK